MSTHTPGPWKIEYGDPGISEDTRIVDLHDGSTVGFVREQRAPFIAAAPRMLEALEHILDEAILLNTGYLNPAATRAVIAIRNEARAAIAQAKGE